MRVFPLLCLAGALAPALNADPIGPNVPAIAACGQALVSVSCVLATINDNDSALSSMPTLYTLTLNGPTLAADTYYWIGLCDGSDPSCSDADMTSAQWSYDSDDSGTSGEGAPNSYYNGSGLCNPQPCSDMSGPYQMSVTEGGTLVFDNTGETPAGSDFVTVGGALGGAGPLYDSFYTGAAAGQITNLELILSVQNASDGGSFQVGLFTDETPEPPSSLLIGAGLGLAAMFRRRAASRRV